MVVCADALTNSFSTMESEYEKKHPDVDIVVDPRGSVMATRLVGFLRSDVLAVADYRLVEKILSREQADWVAQFVSTDIVIAYTDMSKRSTEITPENWFDILLAPDIEYGIADPKHDPCGYYARFTWRLAEDYYFTSRGKTRPLAKELADGCPPKFVRFDALSLVSETLATGIIDYAFVYRAHAADLRLPFVPLPKEINLGDPTLIDAYAKAQIMVPDFRGKNEMIPGRNIAFGITRMKDAPNPEGAADFIRFVLSPEGRAILERSKFRAIQPAQVPTWGDVPEFLKDLAKPEGQ
jgi:molybdate/tungstate transport system substrate-binding protein